MKAAVLVLAAVFVAATATPARAQLGGLGKLKGIADKGVDAKQKFDDYNITDKEELALGEQVSQKLRDRFGVMQDEKVTKYVTLVGTLLAQNSKKPGYDWKFIVLDTDGVNAYAAPGGFVHVTRGLLGLMKNEAELAGVLGHEITHITEKHTVNAIKNQKGISIGADVAGGSSGSLRDQFIAKMAAAAFNKIFEGEFSRNDENESDKIGAQIANKVGYLPTGLADVLRKIDARNSGRDSRNGGWFASHPDTADRLQNNDKQVKAEKLTASATGESRYKSMVTFEAKPITEIATDEEGAAGLASGDKKKGDDPKAKDGKDAKKEEEPKKKGGFGSIAGGLTGKQQVSTQQASSAGARGVGGAPDRDAKGGPNKTPLGVKITAAELDAFKKGIA
jgi:beta-barrel assembly-enhancing protease